MTPPEHRAGGHDDPPSTGTLLQETQLLLEAATTALIRLQHRTPTPSDQATTPPPDPNTCAPAPEQPPQTPPEPRQNSHTGTCLPWCPVCVSVQLLKGEQNPSTTRLLQGALRALQTLGSLLPTDPAADPASPDPASPSATAGRPRPPGDEPHLQRITCD